MQNAPSVPALNPFINRTRVLPFDQQVKLVVVGILVFPFRAILATLIVVLCATIAAVGTLGMKREDYDKPLVAWRAAVLWPLRPLMRAYLFALGVWVTVHGRPAPRSVAPIVVANHRCFLEPIYLIAMLGGTPVSAIENSRIPLVGSVVIALQSLLVQVGCRYRRGEGAWE
jgi:lysophosphatidylcholine acyltransferase / lyso-PAF acetyltransferase